MQTIPDGDLLDQFARTGSEAAFGELVRRHIGLVHSVALRHTDHPQQAEEITQAVFIILARKAAAVGRRTVLSGWLYHTARLTAANVRRAEFRRIRREQEAFMQTTLEVTPPEPVWPELAPLLDEAMGRLGATERDAVVLRYFENKPLSEVGATLGLAERAAQKRVHRGLEKLRRFFAKRGVNSTAAILAGAISAHSVQAAPAGLAKSVTVVAITKGATAGGSTLTLIKGALKIMAWTKAKTAVVAGVGVVLAMGTVATGSKWLWFAGDEIRFEAEGTVTYATTPRDGNSYTNTKHFILARVGHLWKIRAITQKEERTGRGGPILKSPDLYFEMGFDGTNIFTLEQQDPKQFPPETRQSGDYLFGTGRVQKSDSPPGMDGYLFYPVWLAYAAAPYFSNLKDDQAVTPMFALRNFLSDPVTRPITGLQLPAKWNLNGEAFLKDVSWFSDGHYEATGPDGKITIEKYEAPYNMGFLQGRFENLSWTNWHGVSLPSGFKLTVYRPAFTSTTEPNLEVAFTVSGTLEQIRKKGEFSPVPELTTRTRINDARIMRGGRSVPYLSTNRWDFRAAIR